MNWERRRLRVPRHHTTSLEERAADIATGKEMKLYGEQGPGGLDSFDWTEEFREALALLAGQALLEDDENE